MSDARLKEVQEQRAAVEHLHNTYFKDVPNPSMRSFQRLLARDVPARGPVWISRDVFTAPKEDDIRTLLYDSIRSLGQPGQVYPPIEQTPSADVRLEWLGPRPGVGPKEPEPAMSEPDKFKRLTSDVRSPLTVLYVHGGAFYVGSPIISRGATAQLAIRTGGRVAAVAYRLAPQAQFPCAPLDVLVGYLSLLAPGPSARHAPVPASSIVLAGDSAGGALALGLVQVLLDARRRGVTSVHFNGRDVPLELPAGMTLLSPSAEYAWALPSWMGNAHIDFLTDVPHCHLPSYFHADDLWPSTPPRADVYAHPSMFAHPIVCASAARDWTGAPPLWITTGEERLLDSIRVLSRRAAQCSVSVDFVMGEGLPHSFPMMLSRLPQSRACLADWAQACVALAAGRGLRSRARIIRMPGDIVEPLELDALTALTPDDVARIHMEVGATRKPWTGPETAPSRI